MNIEYNLIYRTRNFWLSLAFLKADFHPSTVHPFIIQFVDQIILRNNPAIFPNILLSHFELGVSVNALMVFQKGDPGPCEITWVNHLAKPCGTPAPPSCPQCGVIKQWTLDYTKDGNKHHLDYKRPQYVKGVHKG